MRSAATWILKVKERHKLPTSVTQGLIEDVTSLFQIHLGELHSAVVEQLHGAGVPNDVTSDLSTLFNHFAKPFRGLETNYYQQKYFKQTFAMVVCTLTVIS